MDKDRDHDFELDPVSFITVGTQGPPGQRVFYLQAAKGARVVSLLIEKEQTIALASGLERLLEALAREAPETLEGVDAARGSLALLEPLEPAFRVGNLGIGLDQDKGLALLILRELVEEDAPAKTARFGVAIAQILALVEHIPKLVSEGRPACPVCGEPMDPEGHHCPRRNGHDRLDEG